PGRVSPLVRDERRNAPTLCRFVPPARQFAQRKPSLRLKIRPFPRFWLISGRVPSSWHKVCQGISLPVRLFRPQAIKPMRNAMSTTLSATKATQLTLTAETAADLMTPNPVSIRDVATVREAVALLTDKGFSAAPVIDQAGRPIGVLSRADI